jgi:hypothetical protein
VRQPVGDRGPRGALIAVREGEQGIGGGEPDRGHSGVVAVVFEDLAGLLDQVPMQVAVTSSRSASTFMEQT